MRMKFSKTVPTLKKSHFTKSILAEAILTEARALPKFKKQKKKSLEYTLSIHKRYISMIQKFLRKDTSLAHIST